jgi:DNA-binding GntR family transcriptional regulator
MSRANRARRRRSLEPSAAQVVSDRSRRYGVDFMRQHDITKVPQRDADRDYDDWPTLGPLLDADGVPAPKSRQFPVRTPAAIETLAESTYARLRYALIVGQLAPSESMTLGALARRFGTSVTPVRDALSRLAAAEALHHNHQSSVVVPVLSRDELDELLQLRLAVEGFAFANAAAHHRVSDWRGLKVLHADLCRAIEFDDPVRFAGAVWSVRVAILGVGRSSVLAMLTDRIWCRLGPTFTRMAADIERRRSISYHLGMIVTAIGHRDRERAHKALIDEIVAGTAPLSGAVANELPAPPLAPIATITGRRASIHSESGVDHG